MTWRTALKRNGLWHRGRVWGNSHKSLPSSLFKQQWWKSVNRSSYYSGQAKGQESEVSTLLCGAVELTEPLVFQMLLVHYLTAEKQNVWRCVAIRNNLLFYIQHMHLFPQALGYIYQNRKEPHYSYVWKWSGRALPWCSGLSAGAMQTQMMMSPAAAWPGQNCNSHQKATVRASKTQHSKHTGVLSLQWGLLLMKYGLIVAYGVFPQQL